MLPHRDSLDRGELISQSPENIVVYLEKRRWTFDLRPVWTDCWVSERPTKSRTIQVFPAPDTLLRGYRRIPDESQPPCDEAMIRQRTGRFNPDINDSLTRARVHMVQCSSCSVSRFADMLDTVEAIEQPYSCRIRFSFDMVFRSPAITIWHLYNAIVSKCCCNSLKNKSDTCSDPGRYISSTATVEDRLLTVKVIDSNVFVASFGLIKQNLNSDRRITATPPWLCALPYDGSLLYKILSLTYKSLQYNKPLSISVSSNKQIVLPTICCCHSPMPFQSL